MASIEREVENALLNVVSGITGVNFFTSERGTARTMPSVTVQAQIGSEELVPFSGVFKTPATITYVARADTTARADFDAKFYDILEQLYRDPDLASYLTTNSNITFYVAKVTGDSPAVISQNRTWSRAMTLDIIATAKISEAPSSLLSGLLAYWKLDTTSWIDSSGNGNTLSVVNGTNANITIATGRITNSAGFNANGTFLEKSDFALPSSWTISLWAYINSDNRTCAEETSCFPSLSDLGYIAGNRIVLVEQDGSGGGNAGWVYSNPPNVNYGQFYTWNLGQWVHLCITQDASGLVWYIDNSFYADDAGDESARSATGLAIGAQAAEGDFYGSQGDYRICEYGVWNRALTGAEITSLYNAGAGKTYPFN